MFLFRSPAHAAWPLAAAAACSIGPAWAGNAQTGKLHPWVLVAVFWGAALLSVSVHYLRRYLAEVVPAVRRSWRQSAPGRVRLLQQARLHAARMSAWLSAGVLGLRRSARRLICTCAPLARGVDAARHGWEQRARRAPGALLGWSRSALRARRA